MGGEWADGDEGWGESGLMGTRGGGRVGWWGSEKGVMGEERCGGGRRGMVVGVRGGEGWVGEEGGEGEESGEGEERAERMERVEGQGRGAREETLCGWGWTRLWECGFKGLCSF